MFPVEGSDVPLPAWDFFDDEMVADLDDDLRGAHPGGLGAVAGRTPSPTASRSATTALYDLPVTMVTAEYDAAQLKEWTDAGESGTEEIARLRNVRWVDLHSGHWPQFSRVDDTVRLILEAAQG